MTSGQKMDQICSNRKTTAPRARMGLTLTEEIIEGKKSIRKSIRKTKYYDVVDMMMTIIIKVLTVMR